MSKNEICDLYRKMKALQPVVDESESESAEEENRPLIKDWQAVQMEGNTQIKAEKLTAMNSARKMRDERDQAKEKEIRDLIRDLFSPEESLESLAFEVAQWDFIAKFPDAEDFAP